jgi:hypothetical protein
MTLTGEDRSMECHLAHSSKLFSPSTSALSGAGNSVDIVTDDGLDGPGIESR